MKRFAIGVLLVTAATIGLTAAQVQPERETPSAPQAAQDRPAPPRGDTATLPDLQSRFPEMDPAAEPDEIRRLEIERFDHARKELLLVLELIDRGIPTTEYFVSARQFLDAKLALDESISEQIRTKQALLDVLRVQEEMLKTDLEAPVDADEATLEAQGAEMLLSLSRLQYEIRSANIELAVLKRVERERRANN